MRETKGQKIFNIFNILLMVVLILVFFIPYWVILIASFTDELSILKDGYSVFPSKLSLSAYKFIFTNNTNILTSVKNSVFITVTGTVLSVFLNALFAYPLSRKYLPGRTGIMIYVTITMLFSGGLIPYYLLVRGLGLYNSPWAIIVPGLVSTWYMILIRNFFMTIPDSLEESASIDGANDLTIFFRIILPLSKPVLATITLFSAVGYWNDWYGALLFIADKDKMPVQLLIRELLSSFNQLMAQAGVMQKEQALLPQESTKMAAIIMASMPIILVYPFLQKYFIKGIMIGSIKG